VDDLVILEQAHGPDTILYGISMRHLYCTVAVLLVLTATARAQVPVAGGAEPTGYTIFVRGTAVGRENVTVRSDAGGLQVVTEGRISAPLDVTIRRAEFNYGPDWTPLSFALDANAGGEEVTLRTVVRDGKAITEGMQGARTVSLTHPVSAQSVLHANGIFGSYVALARRLVGTAAGSELRLYVVPQAEIPARVATVTDERMQIGAEFLDVRRYDLVFTNPGGEVAAHLTADREGGLIGVSIPAQAINILRADVAASTARTRVHSNPGDEPVTIPAVGFNLGATITRPPTPPPAGGRYPAVILLSDAGADDRDGFTYGVPVAGQFAGAAAQAGFMAVRYDKRGYGQSGGRSESATIRDAAEDARAVMRWLASRKDVDPRRIALVGHGEGAWIALLAAARERRFAAVVSIAAAAGPGAELVLEQQRRMLDALQLSPEERARRIALQKQINTAVLTGEGWEGVADDVRRQADTPWFQSVLAFEPTEVIEDVRQPILFVHGELDRQVPVDNADRLAAIAKTESRSKSIEVVIVRGVNHLLVPATTGEIAEYATLTDRTISSDVTMAVTSWLTRTFQAIR
jgi:pimeloyl-ACP methyl ester carboxylesterase